MKPVDKFSIQYSELLEYIYPVTQEYFLILIMMKKQDRHIYVAVTNARYF